MTKQAVKTMIKKAKESALDKAMAAAMNAGKPTSTGVMAGAGLGTILAAVGALNRAGDNSDNASVLSNPLLLGALGAAGGYLAGNSFEKSKAERDSREISDSALAGLAGGTGILGTILAKHDANSRLSKSKREFEDFLAAQRDKIPIVVNSDGTKEYLLDKKVTGRGRRARFVDLASPRSTEDLAEFEKLRENLSKAYRMSGNEAAATIEAGYRRPDKLGRMFLDKLRTSSYSPIRWIESLKSLHNPLSGLSSGNISGLRSLGQQLKNGIKGNPKRSALAALALLAGGGKAVYDYARD